MDSGEQQTAWEVIKNRLRTQLSAESFENWFERTSFLKIEGHTLVVRAPDRQTVQFVNQQYGTRINALAATLGIGLDHVELIADSAASRPTEANGTNHGSEGQADCAMPLNPKFTFDSFVVGTCNQLAHAAAQSVASNPSRSYNPLFIYGESGMGKTHLMHAIGRALVGLGRLRIVYTTTDHFTNDVVSGIKNDRMSQVRARYRSADVLLIDDIHQIGTKERTQEEFFHTFNELHAAQKQIVISSDCPPREIPSLVDRLRSRFEWGLMADIQPPDLETKIAILEKKAEFEGIVVPPEVCTFIANKTKSSIRELEGALIKLAAYSSLTKAPITPGMAQHVLRDHLQKQERRVTIDSIQKAVADKFSLKQIQLREKSNRREIVWPRQIAMYLAKELTHASLPEIGRAFGGKHHTTVIHSIDRIETAKKSNTDLNKLLKSLIDSFN